MPTVSSKLNLALFISAAIILLSIVIALSPISTSSPELAIGITYDLTIVAPLIYLLLIRGTKVPKITAVPIFVIGLIVALLIVPAEQTYHLDLIIAFVLPAIELMIISLIVVKVRAAIKLFRERSTPGNDFYLVLKETAIDIIGNQRVGEIFSTEIGMIYYALFSWKKAKRSEYQFTSYHENGLVAILITIIFLVVGETIGLHILLMKWNSVVAWILFGVSLYAAVQILGHLKAMRVRYTEIGTNGLFLKYGLFGDAIIPFSNINKIEKFIKDPEPGNAAKLALLGGMESHNLRIELHNEIIIKKVYGIAQKSKTILLHLDESERFLTIINCRLSTNKKS